MTPADIVVGSCRYSVILLYLCDYGRCFSD